MLQSLSPGSGPRSIVEPCWIALANGAGLLPHGVNPVTAQVLFQHVTFKQLQHPLVLRPGLAPKFARFEKGDSKSSIPEKLGNLLGRVFTVVARLRLFAFLSGADVGRKECRVKPLQ